MLSWNLYSKRTATQGSASVKGFRDVDKPQRQLKDQFQQM